MSQSFLSGVSHGLHYPIKLRKSFFCVGGTLEFRIGDVADSTLTGDEAVSLDMPSGAHLDLITPVRTTLGAFSSEVITHLFDRQFELTAGHFLHWNRQAPDR